MTGDHFLDFHQREEGTLFLPQSCAVSVDCYDSTEVQGAVVASIEELLYALALTGLDFRALDGVTLAADARGCRVQIAESGTWSRST